MLVKANLKAIEQSLTLFGLTEAQLLVKYEDDIRSSVFTEKNYKRDLKEMF